RAELELRAHAGELPPDDVEHSLNSLADTLSRLSKEREALTTRLSQIDALLASGGEKTASRPSRKSPFDEMAFLSKVVTPTPARPAGAPAPPAPPPASATPAEAPPPAAPPLAANVASNTPITLRP